MYLILYPQSVQYNLNSIISKSIPDDLITEDYRPLVDWAYVIAIIGNIPWLINADILISPIASTILQQINFIWQSFLTILVGMQLPISNKSYFAKDSQIRLVRRDAFWVKCVIIGPYLQ